MRRGKGLEGGGGPREDWILVWVPVALATGLINSDSICALAGWVVWARTCVLKQRERSKRAWEAATSGSSKGLTLAPNSYSMPSPPPQEKAEKAGQAPRDHLGPPLPNEDHHLSPNEVSHRQPSAVPIVCAHMYTHLHTPWRPQAPE